MESNEKQGCLVEIIKNRLEDQSWEIGKLGFNCIRHDSAHLQSQHIGGQRQKNCPFESRLGCTVRSCLSNNSEKKVDGKERKQGKGSKHRGNND